MHGDVLALRRCLAVARKHDIEPIPLRDETGFEHGQQSLADRARRRYEHDERCALVGARRAQGERAILEILNRERRDELAYFKSLGQHQRAGRGDALVQNAELTYDRQKRDAQADDDHPQNRVRDGECHHGAFFVNRAARGATSPSSRSRAA